MSVWDGFSFYVLEQIWKIRLASSHCGIELSWLECWALNTAIGMPRRWEGVNPGWPAPIQWSMTLLNDLSVNGVMYPCCLYFAVPGLPPTTKQLWLTLHCSSELTELSWQPQTLRETRGWIYVNIDLSGESYFPTLFKYANSYFKIDNNLETRDFFLINKQFLPAGVIHFTFRRFRLLTPGITRIVLIITIGRKLRPRPRISGTVFIFSAKRVK